MALKILCAGCSSEEREQATAAVRTALGKRAEGASWTVSLVRVADRWSVTLDGAAYGIRALHLVASQGRLREAIAEAIDKPGAPAAAAAPAVRKSETRAPCRCESCGQAFVVVYEAAPDEAEEAAPVACPHCWQVNRVLVSSTAAEVRDYKAEKA